MDFDDIIWANEFFVAIDDQTISGVLANTGDIKDVGGFRNRTATETKGDNLEAVWIDNKIRNLPNGATSLNT